MPYNSQIPQPGDRLRVSQGDILGNFQTIGAAFSLNHVALDLADAGKHKLLTMPRQAFPQIVTGTDLLLYTGLNPVTMLSEIYFKRSTDAPGNGIPLTAQQNDGMTFGWTYLPSGMLMKYGTFAFNGAAPITVLMNGPDYASATSYVVTVSARTVITSMIASPNDTTRFNFQASDVTARDYSYIAIGT